MLRILSLGAGVQSSTLAMMIACGEVPMVDAAIFADTRGEPKAVYEWLNWLEKQLPFPIYRVSRGNLWDAATKVRTTKDGERTYVAIGIPVYTVEGLKKGLGMRQCTRTFKIEPIERQVRKLLGMRRIKKTDGVKAEMLIGISLDEFERMKPSRQSWIKSTWPLVDMGMSRGDCQVWMETHGYPVPPRSACTYCPLHNDDSWLALSPDELSDAFTKERQLQSSYEQASAIRSIPFFHEKRIPLSQVKLRPTGPKDKARQLNMFRNECEGLCGV